VRLANGMCSFSLAILRVPSILLCTWAVQQMGEMPTDTAQAATLAPSADDAEVVGYDRFERTCVPSHNLVNFHKIAIQECAKICDSNPSCLAFEYGVSYGGRGDYRPGDCQPQDSLERAEACDGSDMNLDLYVKVRSQVAQAVLVDQGAIAGAFNFAQAAFDLSTPPGANADIGLALATDLQGEAVREQDPYVFAISEMVRAFALFETEWPYTMNTSDNLLHWLLAQRWFLISQGSGVILWALLYRVSAQDAPASEGYAALFNPAYTDGIGKHMMHVMRLRALPACDRSCLIELAVSLAALSLISARDGDATGAATLMDISQAMLQTVHFVYLTEVLQSASWKPHLTALWGLLHCIAETPLMQGLRDQFELGRDMLSPASYYIPDPMPRCPKEDELAPLPPRIALLLYRMLEVVGTLLSWHGVRWFVSHGTLLGAIRQGGIIPHDCDVDLTVPLADVEMLMDAKLLQALKLNGYQLSMRPIQNIYAVYRYGSLTTPAPWYPQMYITVEPYLNIYILEVGGIEPEATCTYASNRGFHSGFALHRRYVFPTQVIQFGCSLVNAPADPRKYLSSMYENDWPTTVRCRSALTDCQEFVTHRLDANASMALPTGPLLPVEFPDDAAREFDEFPIDNFPHLKRERAKALARARRT